MISNIFFLFFLLCLWMVTEAEQVRCQFEAIKELKYKSVIFSDREELVSSMYGYDIMIDPKDELVSKTIKEFGSYKPENIRAFGKLVKEGDTILIVGSHVGLSAIVYAKLAGPKGKLFIIEPYSISFKLASKNVCINDLSNITTLFRKAVSNKTGKGQLLISLDDTSASLLVQKGSKVSVPTLSEKQKVQVDLIDNILPNQTPIDFAILDVNRREVQALEGMKKTILNSPNLTMVIRWPGFSLDMSQEQFLVRAKQILEWLKSQKFRFYRIKRENYWFPPQNCDDQTLIKISLEEILCLTKQNKVIIDLIVLPENHRPPHKRSWPKPK